MLRSENDVENKGSSWIAENDDAEPETAWLVAESVLNPRELNSLMEENVALVLEKPFRRQVQCGEVEGVEEDLSAEDARGLRLIPASLYTDFMAIFNLF